MSGYIPSADRPAVETDPMPDFMSTWGDPYVLERVVPQLSCGELECLAAVFAHQDWHWGADEARKIHLDGRQEACLVDHNTGEPL